MQIELPCLGQFKSTSIPQQQGPSDAEVGLVELRLQLNNEWREEHLRKGYRMSRLQVVLESHD
jgi:hypothetical protein